MILTLVCLLAFPPFDATPGYACRRVDCEVRRG